MKILQVNNITFGYDKKLNERLSRRLDRCPNTPVIQAIQDVQYTCSFVEDKIEKLEGKGFKDVERNEQQINFLANFLIGAKPVLCSWVDRLFPELGYSKKELEYYSNYMEMVDPEGNLYDAIGINSAYIWRDAVSDSISKQTGVHYKYNYYDSNGNNPKKPNINKGLFPQNFANIGQNNLAKRMGSPDGLVTRFIPYSYSPKSLDEIVGIEDIKEDIEDSIIFPIKYPREALQREIDYGVKHPTFILLYGPPGCGKTMLAEAVANQTGCEMFKLDLSNFGSCYVNQTATNIQKAFDFIQDVANKSTKPILVFMDEMDSVLSKRSADSSGAKEDNKAVNVLLPIISSLEDNKNIILIGATNMYDMLDPAAKSRADIKHYIGLPNEEEIKRLLKIHLVKLGKGQNLAYNDEDLSKIASEFKGYSPRDIVKVIKTAGLIASHDRDGSDISLEHFMKAKARGNIERTDEKKYRPLEIKRPTIGFAN